jgi:copper chaperone
METTRGIAADMVCDGCAASIRRVLARVDGVLSVEIDVATKVVTVVHESARAPGAAVRATLEAAGFPLRG